MSVLANFDECNASLWHKIINLFQKKNKNINFSEFFDE